MLHHSRIPQGSFSPACNSFDSFSSHRGELFRGEGSHIFLFPIVKCRFCQRMFTMAVQAHHKLKHLLLDRKSTRLNSSHVAISYAVFCLKKKKTYEIVR